MFQSRSRKPMRSCEVPHDGQNELRRRRRASRRVDRSRRNEEVNLRAYDSVSEARASIGRYLDF